MLEVDDILSKQMQMFAKRQDFLLSGPRLGIYIYNIGLKTEKRNLPFTCQLDDQKFIYLCFINV